MTEKKEVNRGFWKRVISEITTTFSRKKGSDHSQETSQSLNGSSTQTSGSFDAGENFSAAAANVPAPSTAETGFSDPHVIAWIEDTDALRDEGTIDGMNESSGEEKVRTIRAYYEQKTAEARVALDLINNDIEILEAKKNNFKDRIAQKKHELTEVEAEMESLERDNPRALGARHGVRTVLFVVATIGAAIVLKFLIDDDPSAQKPCWVSPWAPWVVSVTTLLVGSFSLWSPTSLLHRDNNLAPSGREKWMAGLEEVGAPLAATGFFVAMCWNRVPLNELFGILLLLILYFFMLGRHGLGNLQKWSALRTDSRINRRKMKECRLKRDKITPEIQELEKNIDKLDDEIVQIREKHLRENRKYLTQVEQIQQLAESRVHLYESERQRALKFIQSSRNHSNRFPNY